MLMRVMEAREEVEEAAGSGPRLEALRARHAREADACARELGELFRAAARGGAEWLEPARAKVQELTYLHRIRDAVERELEALERDG